ncbi:MAG: hypothetical protein IKI54_06895, partial [Lachnospiraceae bacterium]|nr:hypothetical protein [Lachnospiraceae bacterium]
AAELVRKIAENYRLPYYTISPTYSVCKNHGYIAGEVYKCPQCGATTEVYSRITGYYRPVQNWNDGKAQEFKDRKVYNIGASKLNRKARADVAAGVQETVTNVEAIEKNLTQAAAEVKTEAKANVNAGGNGLKLFATTTCPNCKIVAAQMDRMAIPYTKVYANETPDEAIRYGIKQAPTLVVEENGEVQKFVGVAEIKKFLTALKVEA